MAAGDVHVDYTTINSKRCAIFDGVDDNISINNTDLPAGFFTQGFSVSCWINPTSFGEAHERIVDKSTGTSAQDGFFVQLRNTGAIIVQVNGGTLRGSTSSAVSVTNGLWKHIVATVSNNSTVTIYIDGVQDGTIAASGALSGITTGNDMRIGNRSEATDRSWDGAIGDLKLFNTVLSQEEVTDLLNGVSVTRGLEHQWLHNKTDFTDEIGSANGTNTGSRITIKDDALQVTLETGAPTDSRISGAEFFDLWDAKLNTIGTVVIEGVQ